MENPTIQQVMTKIRTSQKQRTSTIRPIRGQSKDAFVARRRQMIKTPEQWKQAIETIEQYVQTYVREKMKMPSFQIIHDSIDPFIVEKGGGGQGMVFQDPSTKSLVKQGRGGGDRAIDVLSNVLKFYKLLSSDAPLSITRITGIHNNRVMMDHHGKSLDSEDFTGEEIYRLLQAVPAFLETPRWLYRHQLELHDNPTPRNMTFDPDTNRIYYIDTYGNLYKEEDTQTRSSELDCLPIQEEIIRISGTKTVRCNQVSKAGHNKK